MSKLRFLDVWLLGMSAFFLVAAVYGLRFAPDTDTGHVSAGIASCLSAFGCAVAMFFAHGADVRALTEKHRCKMMKAAERELAMTKRRDHLVEQIVEAANYIYVNHDPTNASIAPVRRFLVKTAIDELQAGAPVETVIDRADDPGVIRDVVRDGIKTGEIDLSKGEKWQGKLAQFALADKPAAVVADDKSAA